MIERKRVENMRDDVDLGLLLDEIPHATSRNTNHASYMNRHAPFVNQEINRNVGLFTDESLKYNKFAACVSSPSSVSGYPFNSSPRLVSGGNVHSVPDIDSLSNRVSGNRVLSDYSMDGNGRSLVDEASLARNLSRMYVSDDSVFTNACDGLLNGSRRMEFENLRASDRYWGDYSNQMGSGAMRGGVSYEREFLPSMAELQQEQRLADLMRQEEWLSRYAVGNSVLNSQYFPRDLLADENHSVGLSMLNDYSISRRPFCGDALSYPSRDEMNLLEAKNAYYSHNMVPMMSPHYENDLLDYQASVPLKRSNMPLSVRVPQGNVNTEDSLIYQGENINYGRNRGYAGSRSQNKPQEKRPQLNGGFHAPAFQDNHISCLKADCSISQAQGYIYHMAKDQNGCRILQRMFEEGTSRDVQILFNEIIDHVVELVRNPFGNYMVQKLLEVSNDEQRMHILLKLTEKSGELVRISLNTHGTRVVQKLVELLETRQEIYLVVSALEPDFLSLIKDLNGNHVVQKCLQCFTAEDSKFIYVAAAKYCVEIARHQHGCCVLQRCIGHSNGEQRENLVTEIAANGILLAQDPFGNYVIQFILEQIPSAVPKLTSQFEGNYVQLSMQKFSSHVVEKCLVVCDYEVRSKIICELISATYFDQLLQDPHANYVIQTALRISEGALHNSLVDAIESYKAVSRHSPYSKRIFSHKLLKK